MPQKKESQEIIAIPESQSSDEISIYEKGQIKADTFARQCKRLKNAFPQLQAGFYDILRERVKEKEIGDEQFIAAVNHVIDNCIYPTPTIADIIGFKGMKLYLYSEVCKKYEECGGQPFKYYRPVKRLNNNMLLYASIGDIEKFKMKVITK